MYYHILYSQEFCGLTNWNLLVFPTKTSKVQISYPKLLNYLPKKKPSLYIISIFFYGSY